MSKILNKASLLLNPAGSSIAYKEDKIYSVFPNNGDGDFTFSGGDGGTRVNQQGYIERTPGNIFSNSNTSVFNINRATRTLGPTYYGIGGYLYSDNGSGNPVMYATLSSPPLNSTITLSVFVQNNGISYIDLRLAADGNASFGSKGQFQFASNTFSTLTEINTSYTEAGSTTGGYEYIGNNIWRVWITATYVGGSNYFPVIYLPTGATNTWVGGCQFNIGSIRPYQPTTDRLNYPRITYQNGRGALLTEPARTNLVTNSTAGQYGNSPGSSTLTISPDGTNNATVPVPNSLSDRYQITIFGGSYSSGTRITYSWHYKQLGPHNGSYASEPGGLS